MGSCPAIKFTSSHSLPLLNMVVIGFPSSGKSSIISSVGVDKDESEAQDSSLGKVQLEIGCFILQKRLKIIVFELPSSASKTWKYYYINAHILTFVIDSQRLMRQGVAHKEQIKAVLKEIDEMTPQHCKVIIIYAKVDRIQKQELQRLYYEFMPTISQFRHEICTVKCSAINGEGIDKLAKSILSFHQSINI